MGFGVFPENNRTEISTQIRSWLVILVPLLNETNQQTSVHQWGLHPLRPGTLTVGDTYSFLLKVRVFRCLLKMVLEVVLPTFEDKYGKLSL